jgi:hypothetical protein
MAVLGNGAFGRWLGHENEDLLNGNSTLIRGLEEIPSRRRRISPHTVWQQLGLGIPNVQNCDKQIFVVYQPSIWEYFVIAAQMD